MLVDRYGRVATDLRVSLTDRCNLRCTYCMPAEGLDWLPDARACSPTTRSSGWSRIGVRAARRPRGPVHRRRAAAAPRAGRHRPPASAALEPRPETVADHQRARPGPAGRTRSPTRGSTGSTSASTPLDPTRFHAITRRDRLADVLAGLAAAAAAGLAPVKINAVLHARHQRRRGARAAALVPRPRLRAAVHRADAARRPARLEPRRDGHRRRDPRQRCEQEFVLTPGGASRGGAPRPSCSSSTAARPRSASSRRSPGRSAATATGSGSPPTARSATACSPARSPTCGPRCAPAPRDEELADRWVVAMAGKLPGHGIDDPSFLQPDRPMSAIGG